ncbi:MAG: hypothetical protein O9282_10445 [Flavobacterium sp.]|jgi:hypothetical protein|uniref:hypothetical protein n=1 Tax=Flavobacterium sp. TaxID=239 RepID=UPI0022CB2395|nr:hypothetical protein [Flavobacterium sp.]MCZ8331718.1 hypothetical protein [Flavobacterium sp.]
MNTLNFRRLSREEMKNISGNGKNYIQVTCKGGASGGSTSNSTIAEANAIGTANCGKGKYTIVCVGDC